MIINIFAKQINYLKYIGYVKYDIQDDKLNSWLAYKIIKLIEDAGFETEYIKQSDNNIFKEIMLKG